MSLVVLCPTRGRPDNVREVTRSFDRTRSGVHDVQLVFIVDEDDGSRDEVAASATVISPKHEGGMVAALNAGALLAIERFDPRYLGFIGDDHRFRSSFWDHEFIEHLDRVGGGLAYGNDRFWLRGEIPTQIFMSSAIVSALGWMGLPTCRHLYIDNAWRAMGEALERFFYFPRVIVEHMHPAAGKAQWDASYRANNSDERYAADRAAFESWRASSQFEEDVELARRSLAGAAGR